MIYGYARVSIKGQAKDGNLYIYTNDGRWMVVLIWRLTIMGDTIVSVVH